MSDKKTQGFASLSVSRFLDGAYASKANRASRTIMVNVNCGDN
jgi:hypothetical protein